MPPFPGPKHPWPSLSFRQPHALASCHTGFFCTSPFVHFWNGLLLLPRGCGLLQGPSSDRCQTRSATLTSAQDFTAAVTFRHPQQRKPSSAKAGNRPSSLPRHVEQ